MEILLLIAALASLVWGSVLLARGGLMAGALLILLAGSCFGHPFFNVPLGFLPITTDRVLLLVVVAMYLVYRRFGLADPKPLTVADRVLVAFLAVLALSTFTHDWSVMKNQPLSKLAFFYGMPVALYWVMRQSKLTDRSLVWMFGSLAAFGVYLCATAVAETHGATSLIFPSYIASSEFHEFLGRGRGPYLNPAGLGVVQGACLAGALMLWPRLNRFGRAGLLALMPIYAWGMYSTLTRSVWMGVALELFLIAALILPRAWRPVLLGVSILASVVVVTGFWDQLLAFKRDKELSAQEVAESAKLRPILATVAWHMFQDRPLLGCGFGHYPLESPAYLSDRTTDLPLEKARSYVQHNVFLGLLTETGLAGTALFAALLVLWGRSAWKLWHAHGVSPTVRHTGLFFLAFLGAYLPNAMFADLVIIPMINMLLFFLAGVIDGLDASLSRSTASQPVAATAEPWLIRPVRRSPA